MFKSIKKNLIMQLCLSVSFHEIEPLLNLITSLRRKRSTRKRFAKCKSK